PERLVPLSFSDLSACAEGARDAATSRLAAEEARQYFDLGRGPLLRARLVKLRQHEHLLLLTMHHIVTDSWSLSVLARELGSLYSAFSKGRGSPLPELPIQYADFAQWQRAQLTGNIIDQHLRFWQHCLKGAPEILALPADRRRPRVQTHEGRLYTFVVPPSIRDALTMLGRREGATLFMTMLATFKALLYRYTH